MKNLLSICCFCALISCGKVKHLDSSEVQAAIESRKIKRVTEKELVAKVAEIGTKVKTKMNGDYRIECQNKVKIDSLEIELYNTQLTDLETIENTTKKAVFEAYKYAIGHGQKVGDNMQLVGDTLYIYSFVIEKGTYLNANCANDLGFALIPKSFVVKQL